MITLLSPNFVLQEVTDDDLALASLAWGFTIGFGWLTTWTAMKQTKRIYERRGFLVFRSAYVWMIWLDSCMPHLQHYLLVALKRHNSPEVRVNPICAR